MDNNSQNEMIRKHLEAGNTITPLEAYSKFNCLRLGARIHNLKAMGLAIHSRIINKDGKHYAEYSLPKSEDHARDRYAIADMITGARIILVVAFLMVGIMNAEASLKYKIRRHFNRIEQADQHQNWNPAFKDPYRMERNWDRRPRSYSIFPHKIFRKYSR